MNNPVDQPKVSELIERLRMLCNPLAESWPDTERLTAFVRAGNDAADALSALIGIPGAEKGEAVAWRVYDASQQRWSFTTVEPSAPSPASLSKVEPLYVAPTSERVQALDLAIIEATARRINPGRSEDHIKSVALDALSIIRAALLHEGQG